MSPEQLLVHFEHIGNAPDAVSRFRQFILGLAVRGKVTEQDWNDEPAYELLRRIEAEKARLIRAGDIRKAKRLPNVEEDETPYGIPPNWSWSRLGNLSLRIHYGFTASAKKNVEGVRLLRITDIQNNRVDWSSVPGCEISDEQTAQYLLGDGDILIARTGGTIGKSFLVNNIPVKSVFASYLIRVQASRELSDRYIKLFLESPVYWCQLEAGARGAGQPNVNGRTLGRMAVPLPPLAEQHRIVAKVDDLMALCDELEAAQSKRESRRDRLVAATLHALNNGDTPEDQRHAARFYFNHLPRLTTRPEHIRQLRQTILNLAVRGELVPQDPNDEPASELLKRIEKAKKPAGRHASSTPRSRAGAPFSGRAGWISVRLEQTLLALQTGPFGTSLHQQDYQENGTPVINPASIKDGKIVPIGKMAVGPETLERLSTFKLQESDVVMARRGEMGRCAVVTAKEEGWLCGTGSLILRFTENVYPWFIVKLMSAPNVREYLGGASVGATMQNLNQSILRRLTIGLPPLAEQHRIVAKVDELMAICDDLESRLTDGADARHALLEAALREALAST